MYRVSQTLIVKNDFAWRHTGLEISKRSRLTGRRGSISRWLPGTNTTSSIISIKFISKTLLILRRKYCWRPYFRSELRGKKLKKERNPNKYRLNSPPTEIMTAMYISPLSLSSLGDTPILFILMKELISINWLLLWEMKICRLLSKRQRWN